MEEIVAIKIVEKIAEKKVEKKYLTKHYFRCKIRVLVGQSGGKWE